MKAGRNSQQEFDESGEEQTQVINASYEEIKEPPSVRVEQDPLEEVVKEKSYAKSNVAIDPALANTPIEEPVFTPQPPPPPPQAPPATPPPPPPPPPPVNPAMTHMDAKDKKNAATRAAEMAIQMYVWLHDLGNKAITIPEKKLDKLHKQALIDLGIPMMYGGVRMTMKEFIGQFNSQIGDTFTVSEKFKAEVMPLLIEIFEKRGVGMTTEQQLCFIVGKDLAGKLSIAFMMVQQRKSMIDAMKEATEQFKQMPAQAQYFYKTGQYMPPQQPTTPPPPPAEQPAPPPPPPTPTDTVTYTPQPPPPPPVSTDIIIHEPIYDTPGVPGELNAQGFVEQTINPHGVQPGETTAPDNSIVTASGERATKRKNSLRNKK